MHSFALPLLLAITALYLLFSVYLVFRLVMSGGDLGRLLQGWLGIGKPPQ